MIGTCTAIGAQTLEQWLLTRTCAAIDAQMLSEKQKEAAFAEKFLKRVHDSSQLAPLNPYEYTKRQKKLFHRTLSGLQVGVYRDQFVIFFTLTTKYEQRGFYDKEIHQRVVACEEDRVFNERMKQSALERAEEELNDHFQSWKKRVCRFVQRMLFDRWFFKEHRGTDLRTVEGRRIYRAERKRVFWGQGRKRTQFDRFEYKLCYLKVRTLEGGGVIHGFIRKNRDIPMLDQRVLSKFWAEIHHDSPNISLEAVEEKFKGKGMEQAMNAAFYVCGTYFNAQPVVRQSSSYSWIFKGAAVAWSRGKTVYGIKKFTTVDLAPASYEEHILIKELEIDKYVTRHYTEEIVSRNVLLRRESLLTVCMRSRKSARSDSGYDNALRLWNRIIRDPPKSTRQAKLVFRKRRTREQILSGFPVEKMPVYLNPIYAEEEQIIWNN